jgi:hypothetical protein
MGRGWGRTYRLQKEKETNRKKDRQTDKQTGKYNYCTEVAEH